MFIKRVSDSGMRDREKQKLKVGPTPPADSDQVSQSSIEQPYQIKKLKAQLRKNELPADVAGKIDLDRLDEAHEDFLGLNPRRHVKKDLRSYQ